MQPPQKPDPHGGNAVMFSTGDKVKVVGNSYGALTPPTGTVEIEDVDEDGDYLIQGEYYNFQDVVAADPPAPTVPAPPKFSSPEEADAWLEAHASGTTVNVVTTTEEFDAFATNHWRVQVFRPNGELAFQTGIELKINRADNENVRTVLASASHVANELPF